MSIRNTVKAIIIKDGKMLVNKCLGDMGYYYALPGGGQRKYESLPEAVIRECLEETGYTVTPVRYAALCETISTNEDSRNNDPDYAHRMYHVFICEIIGSIKATPTEQDSSQVGDEWLDINLINTKSNIRLFPAAIGDNIKDILKGTSPVFLGSDYQD